MGDSSLLRFSSIIALFFFSPVISYKLNVPKVLLPNRASKLIPPVNYTLEITDIPSGRSACFKWKSSRPEIVEIYPIYDKTTGNRKCSTSAMVSAISEYSNRRAAIVSAEDIHSTSILRCDVMVDSVSSIEIETTTRQLYLEDSPELFIVRAKNNEGDTFADLDGLRFDWKVQSAVQDSIEDNRHSPARIVAFSESEYETTAAIRRLESQGLQGDRILVEGRATGVASISVRGRDHLSAVPPYSIQLTVMAFLTLEPSADIRAPVGSRIRYSLKLIRYRKAETVPLPSSQYRILLKVTEPGPTANVASFDENASILEALAIGAVQLLVEDRKLEIASASYDLPSSYVYIVDPVAITFTVSTGAWVFEVGRSYEITVGLVDSYGRQLFIADNIVIDVKFPSSLLGSLQLTSRNGTVWRVLANKEGEGEIGAKFSSYYTSDGVKKTVDSAIEGQRSFEIYSPMSVQPSVVVFPPCYGTPFNDWDPCFDKRLVVGGGSGQFSWSLETSNNSSGDVAKLRVQPVAEREAIVAAFEGGPTTATAIVTDLRNRQHKAEAKVIVTNPVKAEFVDGPREIETGGLLSLQLRVFGIAKMSAERLVPFTDCSRMFFDVQASSEAALEILKPEGLEMDGIVDQTDVGCVILPFVGRTAGDVAVTVHLAPRGSAGDDFLSATVEISVYAPLKIISPPEDVLVLTPTSSYGVIFFGGPRRIISDPSSHFVVVEPLGKKTADHFDVSTASELSVFGNEMTNAYTFAVSCLAGTPIPADASLSVSVGNRKSSKITHPTVSTVHLKVVCDFPSELVLRVKEKPRHRLNVDSPPCPLSGYGDADAKPVYIGSPFDLMVEAFGNVGRKFDNFSALQFSWHISDLLRPVAKKIHGLQWRQSDEPTSRFEYYETFHPIGTEGLVKVTAAVPRVVPEACSGRLHKSCEELIKRSVSASIILRLSSYVAVAPETLVVYNHPRSRGALTIQGGSTRFYMDVDKPNFVSWTPTDGSDKVELAPLNDNGEAVFNVYDICLIESPPASAKIIVSSIEKLALSGPSLIMIGTRLTLRVQAFDGDGRSLETRELFKILPLDVRVEGVGLVRLSARNVEDGALLFDTTDTGAATVIVSITDSKTGAIVHSSPHRVQIFPTFEIEPKVITLLAGARFQLRISGGVHHTSSSFFIDPAANGVAFSTNDSKSLSIRGDGLVEAKRPGISTVVARLTNPERNGEILAEDECVIHVVRLASIKIFSPTTTVYSGSVVPLSFLGYGDRHHSSGRMDLEATTVVFPWGTASGDVPLRATWSVDGDGAKVEWSSSDHVSGTLRLKCSKAGVVHVRLSVEQSNAEMAKLQISSGIFHQRSLNASLTVTVVDAVHLVGPNQWKHVPARLLMAPGSSLGLKFTQPLRNTNYAVYDDGERLVAVDDSGVIQSVPDANVGDAVVVIEGFRSDAPEFYEAAAVVVSVRPVSYVQLVPENEPLWRQLNLEHAVYPIHNVLKYSVDFYDHRGLRFNSGSSGKIAIRPNRFDLADVSLSVEGDNHILQVRLKEIGETVIKVWDVDSPNTIFDYVRVAAVHGIQPSNVNVQIGQTICFNNVVSKTTSDSSWTSDDQKILAINPQNGAAIAKSPGRTTVFYTPRGGGAQDFTTSALVTVLEPSSISLEKRGPKMFMDDEAEHIFAVHFDGSSPSACSTYEEIAGSIEPPFTCEFQVSQSPTPNGRSSFRIDSIYLPTVGFACLLKKQSSSMPAIGPPTSDWTINRNASVWARRGSLTSDVLTFPIYKAVLVQPAELSIDNEQSPKAKIWIVAPSKDRLGHVKLTLSPDAVGIFDLDEIESGSGKKTHQTEPTWKKEFVVRLRPNGAIDISTIAARLVDFHVVVTDETTGHVQRVPIRLRTFVKASAEEGSRGVLGFLWNVLVGSKEVYGTVLLILVSAAVTMLSVYFGYRFLVWNLTRPTDTSVTPTFGPAISPASIPWRSYAAQGRTPQLWSVDRSQSPPSPSGSPKTGTAGALLSRR